MNMSNLLSVIIVVIAFYAVIRKMKKASDETKPSSGRKGKSAAAKPARPKGYTNYRPHKDITSVSRDMGDKRNSVLKDDKENDWLARQLREEHNAFKLTSDMFDLKIEHASHCDAKILEQFHRRNCDAHDIDLANGKTIHKK